MTGALFPWVRMLHILFAAAWFGAAAFLTLYLLPVSRQLGAAAGATMTALTTRGFHRFMAASAGLTVLSGLWLYWTLTAGFAGPAMASPSGMVFGLGGLAGLVAAVLGGAVIGRSLSRIEALKAELPDQQPQVAILQGRVAKASRLALALLVFALLAMALGHSL
jgi:uncharacterized membrane protein